MLLNSLSEVLLYGFVLILLCFLCVPSFFRVCPFLRNWFQNLGWGPESGRFSEEQDVLASSEQKKLCAFSWDPIRDSSWDPHLGQLL